MWSTQICISLYMIKCHYNSMIFGAYMYNVYLGYAFSYFLNKGSCQKKVLLLMAGPLRGESSLNGRAITKGREGLKGRAIKEKITFFWTFFSNVQNFNSH